MFNLIMFAVALICMCACWHYADKTGSPLMWIATIVSGCISFVYVLMIGGII